MIFYVVRIQGTLFCESDTVTPWKLAEICGAWNHDSDYPASHACRGSCRQLRGFYTSLYLLTAVGFPPGFSSTVHIYIQTIHRTTQNKQYVVQHKHFGRMRSVPRLCGLYPGICLTTEEKNTEKTWVRNKCQRKACWSHYCRIHFCPKELHRISANSST